MRDACSKPSSVWVVGAAERDFKREEEEDEEREEEFQK
jgi:hypothetical protein